MDIVPGFHIAFLIFENSHSAIYRALRTENSEPVILKVLTDDHPSQRQLSRFNHEYSLLCSMDTMVLAKARCLQQHGNGLLMILEDFEWDLLRNAMTNRRFTLGEFLRPATQVAEVLPKIHSVNIVHKNTNPSRLLWNHPADRLPPLILARPQRYYGDNRNYRIRRL